MLKNKFKIVIFLLTIILTLTITFTTVRAENSVESEGTFISEDPQANIQDERHNESSETISTPNSSDNSLKKEDVYLTGTDVTIDYVVDGNLFVIANNVTINSQIGGDAYICANTVTVGEQGYIFSNLFTLSKNVTINGVVYDLYSACDDLNVTGYIYRDLHVASNNINISGTVGRNAYVGCTNLTFSKNDSADNSNQSLEQISQGKIIGDLKYSSATEASIPDGSVEGTVVFNKETENIDNKNVIEDKIFNLGTFVASIVLIWLLFLWLAPKFFENRKELLMTKKILPVIGLGLISPIVLTLLSILLFVLGLTAPIGLLVLLSLIFIMCISTSIFAITLNTIVCEKLKIEKRLITFGILIATSVILWIISLIPFIGSILKFAYTILGLGIISYSLIKRD